MKKRMGATFGAMDRTRIAMLVAAGSLLAGCAGMSGAVGSAGSACDCPDTPRAVEKTSTRLASPEEASRLTFDAIVGRMSESLLRVPEGSAWRPEAGRAAEVREARTDLSILVEDAEWVLALSRALDGPLPAEDKARLRRLHESYAAKAPHAQVATQVSALLETVRDENLRRDLKKLANRSWEREQRSARAPAAATPPPPAPSVPPEPVAPAPVPVPAPAQEPQAAADSSDASASPERFCSGKRAEAARLFSEARGAGDAATRERLLRESLDVLDACILRHPGTAEAAKARQNRERVEQELKR